MSHVIVQAGATLLLADLVSGIVHWAEDAYARPGAPLIGKLAENNLRHHHRPREFLAKSWLESSWDLLLVAAVLLAVAAWGGWLNWRVWLFAFAITNANQIHKWTHMDRAELPAPVRWLQRLYLLQNARHHGRHHAGTRSTHYCVITNFLNPLLEEIGFWTRIERHIERLTGVRRRSEAEELALLGLPARKAVRTACSYCASATVA